MVVSKREKSLYFLNKLTEEVSSIKYNRFKRKPCILIFQVDGSIHSYRESKAVERIAQKCGFRVIMVRNEVSPDVNSIGSYMEQILSERYRVLYDGIYITRYNSVRSYITSGIPLVHDMMMINPVNIYQAQSGGTYYKHPQMEIINMFLDEYKIDVKNKNVVISSDYKGFTVGVTIGMINRGANVSVLPNSSEDNLVYHTYQSDILISNTSVANQITLNHLGRSDHIILDFGKGVSNKGTIRHNVSNNVEPVCEYYMKSEMIVCPLTLYFGLRNAFLTYRKTQRK